MTTARHRKPWTPPWTRTAVLTLVLSAITFGCSEPTSPVIPEVMPPATSQPVETAPTSTSAPPSTSAPSFSADAPGFAPTAVATSTGSAESGKAVCLSRRLARTAKGATIDCYPYRCLNGTCLTRCSRMEDCAGAHHPSEMAVHGYPLDCMPSGQCVPLPPEHVNPP